MMVDVDWATLAFGVCTALITGGIAVGSMRSQITSLRRELDRAYRRIEKLEERLDKRLNGHTAGPGKLTSVS